MNRDLSVEKIADYSFKFNMCKKRYEEVLNSDSTKLICGKYILCSLAQYLRKKTGKTFREDDFKYYILSMFDVSYLNFVKERIMALI